MSRLVDIVELNTAFHVILVTARQQFALACISYSSKVLYGSQENPRTLPCKKLRDSSWDKIRVQQMRNIYFTTEPRRTFLGMTVRALIVVIKLKYSKPL